MFFFQKTRPVLKDLITDFVDIHAHFLPGIDDGAPDFGTAAALVNSMQEIGMVQFTATPHVIKNIWDNTADNIKALEKETKERLRAQGMELPFRAAAEYMMDESFSSLIQETPLLTLKDNYVLVEMSYINPPIQLYQILFELRLAGYQPVLAHPERYFFYHNNFEEYQKLKRAGCLLQLNLLSAVGYYGRNVAKIAQKLLEKGMYDFAGSDIHHDNHIQSFSKKTVFSDTAALEELIRNNDFFKETELPADTHQNPK